jgi:hypothetical protein
VLGKRIMRLCLEWAASFQMRLWRVGLCYDYRVPCVNLQAFKVASSKMPLLFRQRWLAKDRSGLGATIQHGQEGVCELCPALSVNV